jgi:acetylglutamate kinase
MHDGEGALLNCNADSVATAVALGAAAVAPTDLVFCFEKRGVLRDAEDDNSVIDRITPENYQTLKAEGAVKGGMIPKIENALEAVKAGVQQVIITKADAIDGTQGTIIS